MLDWGKSGDHQTPLLRCRSCTVRLSFARRSRAAASSVNIPRAAASCAPSPLLPRRNTATDPTGDVNANNAAGGAAPAGGAPPVAPAYPPLVVEAKPYSFVIGADLPPPFQVDPLGNKTTPHAPRVTSLNGPVPKDARIIGIHVEGRYVDSRPTDPVEFRSLLKTRAVHRKIHFII